MVLNHWPDITCPFKAGKHDKYCDFTKVKPFDPFYRHVNMVFADVSAEHSVREKSEENINGCPSRIEDLPKCTVAAARECFLHP